MVETARKPSTNLGNLSHTNAALALIPGARVSASPRAAQYSANPSTTNPMSALRVDLTTVAMSPACSEYRRPVATVSAVLSTARPAHSPNS
ncbi:Uncharacterised protein [Mycobacteroides abscessus subsp. abscessus]|nr:Uncharacterised protein [Mycobacteroides abscessus subsp. abscessus]